MKSNIPTEHIEQVNFVEWFRYAHRDLIIFAVPNGEHRHPSVARRLKNEGVLAGVPDLFILLNGGKTLMVEMKRAKGGALSKPQKDLHPVIKALGFDVLVCKGAMDAKKQVEAYLNELSG